MAWLLRQGEVLASIDVPASLGSRLLGFSSRRPKDTCALWLRSMRFTHSIGTSGALDVAYLDGSGSVMATVRLARWRIARPRRGSANLLVAEAGAFDRWGLAPGDRLELKE